MSSASELLRRFAAAAVPALLAACAQQPVQHATLGLAAQPRPDLLRVCADPNNLPFSNERGEGFENRIAQIVADDLHMQLAYTWWPQRRGFVRNTLKAGKCDLVVGVPSHYELVATTRPYYRSTYVFVTRRDRNLQLASFDDPRLHTLQLGVHVVGDDYNNVPPAQALAWRSIVDNVHGYPIYGDYARPDPPRDLIDAVARGEVDVGMAWGPLAGYFAQRQSIPLQLVPVAPQVDRGVLPMSFAIAMGVRRGERAWRDRVQAAVDHRGAEIQAVLRRYGVPLLPMSAATPVARKE
jgi:mxaJ protein